MYDHIELCQSIFFLYNIYLKPADLLQPVNLNWQKSEKEAGAGERG